MFAFRTSGQHVCSVSFFPCTLCLKATYIAYKGNYYDRNSSNLPIVLSILLLLYRTWGYLASALPVELILYPIQAHAQPYLCCCFIFRSYTCSVCRPQHAYTRTTPTQFLSLFLFLHLSLSNSNRHVSIRSELRRAREVIAFITSSPWFEYLILFLIILNSVVLALTDWSHIDEDPMSETAGQPLMNGSWRNTMLYKTEIYFAAFYTVEFCLKGLICWNSLKYSEITQHHMQPQNCCVLFGGGRNNSDKRPQRGEGSKKKIYIQGRSVCEDQVFCLTCEKSRSYVESITRFIRVKLTIVFESSLMMLPPSHVPVIAQGLYFTENSYFKDFWNIFDFVVLVNLNLTPTVHEQLKQKHDPHLALSQLLFLTLSQYVQHSRRVSASSATTMPQVLV